MDVDRLWFIFCVSLMAGVLALLKHHNDELEAKLPREFERGRIAGRADNEALRRRADGSLRERIAAHTEAVETGEAYVKQRVGRNGQ